MNVKDRPRNMSMLDFAKSLDVVRQANIADELLRILNDRVRTNQTHFNICETKLKNTPNTKLQYWIEISKEKRERELKYYQNQLNQSKMEYNEVLAILKAKSDLYKDKYYYGVIETDK